MSASTRVEFQYSGDLWAAVDAWAGAHGFKPQASAGPGRLYQKGTGFLVAPMMLRLEQQGSRVILEAWIRCGTFVRLFALFLIPGQMGVQSGGFKLALPRKIAREAINKLLAQLGQGPIP